MNIRGDIDCGDEVSAKEAGRRGGLATLRNKGPEFFKTIGKKGGQRTAKLYSQLLKEFGKAGGRPRCPTIDAPGGERNR